MKYKLVSYDIYNTRCLTYTASYPLAATLYVPDLPPPKRDGGGIDTQETRPPFQPNTPPEISL